MGSFIVNCSPGCVICVYIYMCVCVCVCVCVCDLKFQTFSMMINSVEFYLPYQSDDFGFFQVHSFVSISR